MIKSPEELKEQATKIGLHRWRVHNCSMCGYPCGYEIHDNEVFYDSGCDCVSYSNIQPRSWEDLANSYNMNQPENNPDISQKYLDELNDIWKFEI
jgi:hypothetical protein